MRSRFYRFLYHLHSKGGPGVLLLAAVPATLNCLSSPISLPELKESKSWRSRLPVFAPDMEKIWAVKDDKSGSKEAIHAAVCSSVAQQIESVAEVGKSTSKVTAFYLAEEPFDVLLPSEAVWQERSSKTKLKCWIKRKLSDGIQKKIALTRLDWNIDKELKEYLESEVFDKEVTNVIVTVLQSLKQGKSRSLVDSGLLSMDAFLAMQAKLAKLTPTQLKLLDINMEDFMLLEPMVLNLRVIADGDNLKCDAFIIDVAFYASKHLAFVSKGMRLTKYKDEKIRDYAEELIISDQYPFDTPKQLIINMGLSFSVKPTVGDFHVTQFNVIVAP